MRDALSIDGSTGDDFVALGQDGFALDRDGDLDVSVARHPEVDPIQAGPDITIRGDRGGDVITAQGGSGAGAPYAGYYGPLEIWGGSTSEFDWDDAPNELTGGEGYDRLQGGYGVANTIAGGGGDDGVFGAQREDTLAGGDGRDSLWGDYGNDALAGDAGDDSMHGGGEDDVLGGGDGDDSLDGESGVDVLKGGAGNDSFSAQDSEADTLDGGDGEDWAFVDGWDSATAIEQLFYG